MKKLLPLIIFFISTQAFAHLGSISGTVFDEKTNLPIQGVSVQLTGLNKAILTNELGQYHFENLVAAPYKIEFLHLGFKAQAITAVVKDDENTFLKVSMGYKSIELTEIVVPSQRPHDQQLITAAAQPACCRPRK